MITTRGRTFIKRYLAGQAGAVAGAMSIGIGDAAPSLADTRMQFEFARIPITLSSYDFINDKLIFKGNVDENVSGRIYEIGLWTAETDPLAGNRGSTIITSFDSEAENWVGGIFDTTNTRIGMDSLRHTLGPSATTSSTLSDLSLDLSEHSNADTFVFAYNITSANIASVKFRFRTDVSNYYEFSVANPTAGYKITSLTKGAATVTGVPDWASINDIWVETITKSSGSGTVDFDGIRLEDVDTISPEYGLIARFVPTTPITKDEGMVFDLEYAFNVTA